MPHTPSISSQRSSRANRSQHHQTDSDDDVSTNEEQRGDASNMDALMQLALRAVSERPGKPLYLTSHELDRDTRGGAVILNNREDYRLRIAEDGRVSWRNAQWPGDQIEDTGMFRFVIDRDGAIYATDERGESENASVVPTRPLRPRFHHGSLVGDEWPAYAGRAHAKDGEIYYINNHTGHFAQSKSDFDQVFAIFQREGANISRAQDLWFHGHMHSLINPQAPCLRLGKPLRTHPDSRAWNIYEDSENIQRTDLSPSQYRQILRHGDSD